MTSAAGLIIGNEVLSAKVVDENGPYLIRRLREHGVHLRLLHMVPDEVDAIVECLIQARRQSTFVVTSGGVGPTHDDVTARAVALALGRRVVRLPEMIQQLQAAWGNEAPPPAALRMAEAPEGTQLLSAGAGHFPVMACCGVFLLPGVPRFFRAQLEVVLAHIPSAPVVLKTLYVARREPDIAQALDEVALGLPHVAIGSYPALDADAAFRVRITIEHPRAEEVELASSRLAAALPPGCILRQE